MSYKRSVFIGAGLVSLVFVITLLTFFLTNGKCPQFFTSNFYSSIIEIANTMYVFCVLLVWLLFSSFVTGCDPIHFHHLIRNPNQNKRCVNRHPSKLRTHARRYFWVFLARDRQPN